MGATSLVKVTCACAAPATPKSTVADATKTEVSLTVLPLLLTAKALLISHIFPLKSMVGQGAPMRRCVPSGRRWFSTTNRSSRGDCPPDPEIRGTRAWHADRRDTRKL